MQIQPFKIAISGALGKMGKNLIKELYTNHYKDISLSAAIVKKGNNLVKKDIGKAIGIGKIGISITDSIKSKENNFDLLIDFTNPNNTIKNLNFCALNNKKIVIGTTGFSEAHIKIIKTFSKSIGIVISPNYSIGINIILNLLKKTTPIIGEKFDIEIVDIHHREKKDAPSGTSIEIGKVISKSMNWNFHEKAIYSRSNRTEKRKNNEIGFSSIRAGDIVGEHKVIFANSGEQIEITHKATNRLPFSKGAIQAAQWLMLQKKTGLFNMSNVLNI
ncbi:MAG: 4-hydroxy-tetrahydrodipicolinate reductase [Buchnera aphidicola (Schlechtendalia chinensis)]